MKIILECLNEPSFSKCLDLDSRITIGRQIAPKSLAEPTNGIFDSKVLSRYHAELFVQDGLLYIRDLNSSNGTFVNGVSISNPSGKVGDPHQLMHLDVIEFGVDIPDDDQNDLYKKVECKLMIVDQANQARTDSISIPDSTLRNTANTDFIKLSENDKLAEISNLISLELKEINETRNLYQEYGKESVKKIEQVYKNHQELKEFCENRFQEFKDKQVDLDQIHKVQTELQETVSHNTREIQRLKNQIKWTSRIQNVLIISLSLGGLLLVKKYSKL